MILSIIGSCTVVISMLLCSDNLYRKMILRESELKDIICFFESVKSKILNNIDIPESVKISIANCTFFNRSSFERFCNVFFEKPITDYYTLWRDVRGTMFPLKDEDIKVIDDFFKSSFETDVLIAVEKTENTIKYLKNNVDSIIENKSKRRKILYNTGVCIGLLTVVLLI